MNSLFIHYKSRSKYYPLREMEFIQVPTDEQDKGISSHYQGIKDAIISAPNTITFCPSNTSDMRLEKIELTCGLIAYLVIANIMTASGGYMHKIKATLVQNGADSNDFFALKGNHCKATKRAYYYGMQHGNWKLFIDDENQKRYDAYLSNRQHKHARNRVIIESSIDSLYFRNFAKYTTKENFIASLKRIMDFYILDQRIELSYYGMAVEYKDSGSTTFCINKDK